MPGQAVGSASFPLEMFLAQQLVQLNRHREFLSRLQNENAQISLLAGMEAAKIMVDAHVGILRVVPAPEPWQIDRLRPALLPGKSRAAVKPGANELAA